MRKKIIFSIIFLIILSGCGKKETITCKIQETKSGSEIIYKSNIYLENNKLKTIDTTIEINTPNNIINKKEEIIDNVKEQYKELEEKYEIEPVTQETDNGIKIKFEITPEQIKKNSGDTSDNTTREDIIEIFKKQGFECE